MPGTLPVVEGHLKVQQNLPPDLGTGGQLAPTHLRKSQRKRAQTRKGVRQHILYCTKILATSGAPQAAGEEVQRAGTPVHTQVWPHSQDRGRCSPQQTGGGAEHGEDPLQVGCRPHSPHSQAQKQGARQGATARAPVTEVLVRHGRLECGCVLGLILPGPWLAGGSLWRKGLASTRSDGHCQRQLRHSTAWERETVPPGKGVTACIQWGRERFGGGEGESGGQFSARDN